MMISIIYFLFPFFVFINQRNCLKMVGGGGGGADGLQVVTQRNISVAPYILIYTLIHLHMTTFDLFLIALLTIS